MRLSARGLRIPALLSQGYRVVAFDQLGTGASKPAHRYSAHGQLAVTSKETEIGA